MAAARRKVLGALAVALVAAFGVALLLRTGGRDAAPAAPSAASPPAANQAERSLRAADDATDAALDGVDSPRRAAEAAPLASRPTAMRLAGRVLVPRGAPDDPTLAVAALAQEPAEVHPRASLVDPTLLERPIERAEPITRAAVGADGAFELELEHAVDALWLVVEGRFLALERPVRARPAERGAIVLRPELGARIHGTVRGAPAGVIVLLGEDAGGSTTRPDLLGVRPLIAARTDAGGRFELRGVPAGATWWVGARAPGRAAAVRGGLATAPGVEIEVELVPAAGATLRGRVVREAASASDDSEQDPIADAGAASDLAGSARSDASSHAGAGLQGIVVTALPADDQHLLGARWLAPSAVTAADGAFALENVALGANAIEARTGRCAAEPLALDVRADADDLRLALDPKQSIQGRVLLPDGAPAAGATVDLRGRRVSASARAGSDGAFRIDCVDSDAEGDLVAHAPGRIAVRRGVKAGEEVELVLEALAETAPAAPGPTGRVLAPDGSPVAGAEVFCQDAEQLAQDAIAWAGASATTRADADGRFELPAWASSGMAVVARAPGFAPSLVVPVAAAPFDVALRASGALFGTVYEGNGRAPRFQVTAFHAERADARIAGTDARGAFRFEGLVPGRYVIEAAPLPPAGLDYVAALAFRDEARGRRRRASAEVVAGEDVRVDLGAPPEEAVRVFGRVTAGGEPVLAQVAFLADGASSGDARVATAGADGAYEIEVAPGRHRRYVATQQGPDGGAGSVALDVVDVPHRPEHRLDVALPAGRIRVRVSECPPEQERLRVLAIRLDAPPGAAGLAVGVAAEDGGFMLAGLAPGRYQVSAEGLRGLALRPALVELTADATADVALACERAPELVVRPVAEGGAIVPGARVVAFSGGTFVASPPYAELEPIRIDGVAPGPHTILATAPGLAGRAECVLRAGERTELRVELGPAGTVRVEVVDDEDRPVLATVDVAGDLALPPRAAAQIESLMPERSALTAVDLRATVVGPLPFGRYAITATTADGRVASTEVDVRAVEPVRVRMTVGR